MNKIKGKYRKNELLNKKFKDFPNTSSQTRSWNMITDSSKKIEDPTKRFSCLKNICKGSASTIYLYQDNLLKNKVIVKKIKKNEYWRSELNILYYLKNITSDRILKLSYFYETCRRAYIVTRYYNGHNLYDHVDLNCPYTEEKGLKILKEMALCIKECHDNNVLHLDIKCENYVVNSDILFYGNNLVGGLVLIDFGHSEIVKKINKVYYNNKYGTILYVCPEGHLGGLYSEKSDIWSFGVCMSIILLDYFPFEGDDDEYYNNSLSYNMIENNGLSENVYQLMKNTLNPDYKQRPNIYQVIQEIERILALKYH